MKPRNGSDFQGDDIIRQQGFAGPDQGCGRCGFSGALVAEEDGDTRLKGDSAAVKRKVSTPLKENPHDRPEKGKTDEGLVDIRARPVDDLIPAADPEVAHIAPAEPGLIAFKTEGRRALAFENVGCVAAHHPQIRGARFQRRFKFAQPDV
ncbi:hypothetical protein [Brevundimonas nasdae]|uniref:hypothetical protein n=1 Tax=Brevundimonas nasdae TaxID=172043 RepID=UPI00196A17E9|nr:hypothetical protein [Brevundimonas nasdae]